MDYKLHIQSYTPINEQETSDQQVILSYLEQFPHTILTRENKYAHFTSSGFILNHDYTKALMIHHNIYQTWAWTGGHVDGDTDFLHVAIKEALEETGLSSVTPICPNIASLDIIPVPGHMKKGAFVSAHLHLNVSYLLVANEHDHLTIKEDENSGVQWINVTDIHQYSNEPDLIYIYNKLISRAKEKTIG